MSLLDITAIGLQIILPLSLIAWLAFAPMKSRLGFSSMRFQPASSSPVFSWTLNGGMKRAQLKTPPAHLESTKMSFPYQRKHC